MGRCLFESFFTLPNLLSFLCLFPLGVQISACGGSHLPPFLDHRGRSSHFCGLLPVNPLQCFVEHGIGNGGWEGYSLKLLGVADLIPYRQFLHLTFEQSLPWQALPSSAATFLTAVTAYCCIKFYLGAVSSKQMTLEKIGPDRAALAALRAMGYRGSSIMQAEPPRARCLAFRQANILNSQGKWRCNVITSGS